MRQFVRPLARVFKLMWGINRGALLVTLVTDLGSLVAAALTLFLLRLTINLFLGQSHDYLPLVGLLVVVTVQQVLATVLRTAQTLLRQEVTAEINSRLLEKLQRVPFRMFEDNEFQAGYGLLVREASYRPAYMVDVLTSIVMSFSIVIGIMIALAIVASPLILLLFLMFVPALIVEGRFRNDLLEVQTMSSPQLLRMQLLSQQSVDPGWQRDLRVYRSNLLPVEYRRLSREYLARVRAVALGMRNRSLGLGILGSTGLVLAIVLSVIALRVGRLTAAEAVTVLTGVYLALGQSRSLATSVGGLAESLNYNRRLMEFLESGVAEVPEIQVEHAAPGSMKAIAEVHLGEVIYSYRGASTPALKSVTCSFPVGMTAVVGANGAGKSTLIRLLAGLDDPTFGTIKALDDRGRDVPFASVARSVVFQNPAQLRMTVREIVTMAPTVPGSNANDERLQGAIETAGLSDLVAGFAEGVDTALGMGFGGVTDLSGGQWQRLAVARLVYHDAPLLLLDEPSLSLDPTGERSLIQTLERVSSSRVVVVVTHRYETVLSCDRLVALSDGEVVQVGAIDRRGSPADFYKLFLAPVDSISEKGRRANRA